MFFSPEFKWLVFSGERLLSLKKSGDHHLRWCWSLVNNARKSLPSSTCATGGFLNHQQVSGKSPPEHDLPGFRSGKNVCNVDLECLAGSCPQRKLMFDSQKKGRFHNLLIGRGEIIRGNIQYLQDILVGAAPKPKISGWLGPTPHPVCQALKCNPGGDWLTGWGVRSNGWYFGAYRKSLEKQPLLLISID